MRAPPSKESSRPRRSSPAARDYDLVAAEEKVKAAGVRREEANQRVRDSRNDAKLRGATSARLCSPRRSSQSEFNLACMELCAVKNKNS